MRNVSIEDSQILLAWRNDIQARRYSHSQIEISEKEHGLWLTDRLKRVPSEPFWMFEEGLKIIGVVRLDFDSHRQYFRVSILINPMLRGAGYGSAILNHAISSLIGQNVKLNLHAEIHKENLISQKLFTNCGFQILGSDSDFLFFKRVTSLD